MGCNEAKKVPFYDIPFHDSMWTYVCMLDVYG